MKSTFIDSDAIFGIILGIIPVIAIAIYFRNDNLAMIQTMKKCFTFNLYFLSVLKILG
jgi:hypothetical protein